jgi:hypothetical protein
VIIESESLSLKVVVLVIVAALAVAGARGMSKYSISTISSQSFKEGILEW